MGDSSSFEAILQYLVEQGMELGPTVTLILHNGSVHTVPVPEGYQADSSDS